jgi:hypothetical protein
MSSHKREFGNFIWWGTTPFAFVFFATIQRFIRVSIALAFDNQMSVNRLASQASFECVDLTIENNKDAMVIIPSRDYLLAGTTDMSLPRKRAPVFVDSVVFIN